MNQRVLELKNIIGKDARDYSPSPYGQWLNGKLLSVDEGIIEVGFQIREEWTNPAKMMHGGVFSGILDDMMGMTVFTLGYNSFFVASNLSIDFLRPAKQGDSVVAKSRIIRAGKNLVNVACEIFSEDGKILAQATSNMVKTSFETK